MEAWGTYKKRGSRSGAGALELLVAISVIVVLGGLALSSFVQSRNVRDTTSWGHNVISLLRLAQSRSLGAQDNATWGVHFEASRAVLFRGVNYSGASFTETHLLPGHLEIVNIALAGGGTDVVFRKLDGRTDQPGTLEVRARGSATGVFSITVESSGKSYQSGTAPLPTNTRSVDTRHRSFDFNSVWSIKNSTTLTLTFSDPDLVYPIAMAPYFDLGKTKFDWSGTIAVGGYNQTLRIHTTFLSDTNTILSVDRDCRKNNKKVKITIDANDIATYEADCRTVTVHSSGGTMSEP